MSFMFEFLQKYKTHPFTDKSIAKMKCVQPERVGRHQASSVNNVINSIRIMNLCAQAITSLWQHRDAKQESHTHIDRAIMGAV